VRALEAAGPVWAMTTPARIIAPPTSWSGPRTSPKSRLARTIVQIGSTVLTMDARAAPIRWATA
jgi:hypothetical protein